MEVLKMGKEDEGNGEEIELSLELSIGGRYGKSAKFWGSNLGKNTDSGASRSDFSCGFGANVGIVLELEGQKLKSRIEEREIRERDGFGEELARKKEKNVGNEGVKGLSLAISGLYPEVQRGDARNVGSYGGLGSGRTTTYGSLERSCSAVSDYQSTEQKGGSGSDSASHSSNSRSRQSTGDISKTPSPDQLQHSSPSPPTEADHPLVGLPKHVSNVISPLVSKANQSKPTKHSCDSPRSTEKPPSEETSSTPIDKPPKPPNQNTNNESTRRMPCVTTTGNGPNGKTIAGFLYKYTNAEVTIMCVCHGGFFTPAEFVEHAGGINISHPLRHIAVIPSPFG